MDLKELTNNKLIKDFQCISIKSKKEPHLRCPCKKKIINGSYQLFCGKHNKTKNPIIFNEKMKSFSVEISHDGSYFKDLHWGMHDTIQIDLDVVIQKMD